VKAQSVILVFGLLSSSLAVAVVQPPRDEAKASHYLYCATINRYWVETLRDRKPDSPEIAMRKNASDYFWQATILLSDLEFAKTNLGKYVQQVSAMVKTADQDHGVKFKAEDLSCATTMRDEVVPLFKAAGLVPAG
jgi:hypothetical protein